jgi:hypothetical protein
MFPDESNPKEDNFTAAGASPSMQSSGAPLNLEHENFGGGRTHLATLIPSEIALLRGVVERFDPASKALVNYPLANFITSKLKAHFQVPSLDAVKLLSAEKLSLILNGEAEGVRIPLTQLVVLPSVSAENIPEIRIDPQGIFSLIERFTTLHSAVVFFSSPDIAPVHNQRLIDYTLNWVDRVDLRRDLLTDRVRAKPEARSLADWNSYRKLSYERIPFKDLRGNEWAAHILFSKPDQGYKIEQSYGSENLSSYTPVIAELGINLNQPLKILSNPREIISLLGSENASNKVRYDVIDLRKLGGVNKAKIFNTLDSLRSLVSALSERGVIFSSFNAWDYKIKNDGHRFFEGVVAEENQKSASLLRNAQSRHLDYWGEPDHIWLRNFEHRVISADSRSKSHVLLSKEIKVSTLPDHLAVLTPAEKSELVRAYKVSAEFKELIESSKSYVKVEIINFILDELISSFDGRISSLTPLSKLSHHFGPSSRSITQYQSELSLDIKILANQERARGVRRLKESVVRQVEQEVESHLAGRIELLSNNFSLRERYGIPAGFLKRYLQTGLSPWTQRYRDQELAKASSRLQVEKGEFISKVCSHIRNELLQYFETGTSLSKSKSLMKRFSCSQQVLSDAIRRGLNKEEQEERLRIIFDDHYSNAATALKPAIKVRLNEALLSIRRDIDAFKHGSSKYIQPPTTRAKLVGITPEFLEKYVKQIFSDEDLIIYQRGVALGRREIKAQTMKNNRANSKKYT